MTTTIQTAPNFEAIETMDEREKINNAFIMLSKSLGNRKYSDFLKDNYDEDFLKTELIKFAKDYLLSTVQDEIKAMKKDKSKLLSFNDLITYLFKNVCSKNIFYPHMNSVYYDKENSNIVATDAHILACLPVKYLPINDYTNYVKIKPATDEYIIYNNASYNSYKLDKYSDIINEDLERKYVDYMNVYPEKNYLNGPYFSISPFLFNGLKTLGKIAKKLKISNLPVKLSYLDQIVYINLPLLCRYIELHQKIYGNYEYIFFTRNSQGGALYNIDLLNKFMLLVMPIYVDKEEDKVLILDLEL